MLGPSTRQSYTRAYNVQLTRRADTRRTPQDVPTLKCRPPPSEFEGEENQVSNDNPTRLIARWGGGDVQKLSTSPSTRRTTKSSTRLNPRCVNAPMALRPTFQRGRTVGLSKSHYYAPKQYSTVHHTVGASIMKPIRVPFR